MKRKGNFLSQAPAAILSSTQRLALASLKKSSNTDCNQERGVPAEPLSLIKAPKNMTAVEENWEKTFC
jgi:hypothetical protein